MSTLAYIGNHEPAFSTESFVARGFEENGWTVERIQQSDADASMDRIGTAELVLYTRSHNQSALGPHWTSLWRGLEAHGAVTASLHLDRFWDLEREHLITGPDTDPLFTTQWVWTADGGEHPWEKYGINHRWLIPAADRLELTTMPGRDRPRMRHDVAFTGSCDTYHAAYPQRRELIEFLRARYGPRFAHYGHGGGQQVVRQQQLNDLYASAKVIVGDSCFANGRPDGVTNDHYWSDRIPEVMGRGGVLIHAHVPGLIATMGTTGYIVHDPGNWNDLGDLIDEFVADVEHAAWVRERARDAVLAKHTWTHRVRELLVEMGFNEEGTAA